jgi:hypothetical protein
MVNLTWQFQAAVPGGPSLTINQPNLQLGAYDVVSVTVPASTSGFVVPVQPSATPGDVILLVVVSSKYDAGITYTVDSVGVTHTLDGPQMLLGSGAVSLLNSAAPPQKLTFANTLTSDITLQVLAGRKVP